MLEIEPELQLWGFKLPPRALLLLDNMEKPNSHTIVAQWIVASLGLVGILRSIGHDPTKPITQSR